MGSRVDEATGERTAPLSSPLEMGSTASPRFSISVTEGPDVGATLEIDAARRGPVLVGQSRACDLALADRQASRRHVAFDIADRLLRVTDLGSTNGTRVDGVSIVEALLRGGETVRLGQTTIAVHLLNAASIVYVSSQERFGRSLGASVEMRRLYPLFEKMASSAVPVILEGETGTGKELLAESVHEQGPRASAPFVVFDCTAVAPTLIESELFGHERGAFTGALGVHRGVFEQAHGGTLLIDEIGDLPLALQPKLLRVLERSELRRVGGERTIQVDVRVLAATRRNLDREVQAGRFRDDLYHRLAVARIELPPLRRRHGDIPLLARSFCAHMGGAAAALPEALLRAWEDYAWPGNVRELRNSVARRLAFGELAPVSPGERAGDAEVQRSGYPSGVLERILAQPLAYREARRRLLDAFEEGFVEQVLAAHGGNVSHAAEASGLARRQLQRVKARVGRR